MRILLIEDDLNFCETLRFQLEQEAYEVDVCHDGRDGGKESTALGGKHESFGNRQDRKSTRLNSSHYQQSRMPSSA